MNQQSSQEESNLKSSQDSPSAPPPPPAPVPETAAPEDPDKSWSPEPASAAPASDTQVVAEEDPPSIEPKTRTERPRNMDPEAGATEQPTPVAAAVERGSESEDDLDDDFEARKIRLSIARIDTWSTLKLSFLLSVAIGIGIIVASACVWLMLDGMAVFTKIDDLLQSVAGDEAQIEILQYFEFNKVVSLATIIAVADVIIITLIATLGSVIYNLVSSLIGGLTITLTDE